MKSWMTTILIAALGMLAVGSACPAEIVSEDESWTAAENYLSLILNRKGEWGGAGDAHIADMQELWRGERLLGRFFRVKPQGFIITSLFKELSPVKAYSATSDLDPTSDEGLSDLLKGRMAHTVSGIELRIGKSAEEATRDDWDLVIETDYRPAWDELTAEDFDGTLYQPERGSRAVGMNYQEGEVLLTSGWHQQPPYNDQCPDLGCDEWEGPPYYGYNTNARVGCVATAGVQILRYWNWPPCNSLGNYVDAYNWTNMPDYTWITSPQDQIDCVAAASYSVGNSVGMDYGCDGSSAMTEDMEQVFQNRRYHDHVYRRDRSDDSASQWYDKLCANFNANRPVQYRVDEHSIVGDGWQIIEIGGVPTKQYHMNYGWNNSYNAWYDLDDLHLGGSSLEYALLLIYPENAMGANLFGYHATEWESINHFDKPTRYLDQDTSARYAEFEAGQAFQYLRPGLHILHIGPYDMENSYMIFNGAPGAVTEFYHGAPFGDVKIRIADGAIRFSYGGEMVLH